MTVLEDYVFQDATALKTVDVSKAKITDIGRRTFSGSGLTSFVVPSTTRAIGYGAFYECENLADITLSDAVITIGNYAFARCYALKELHVPDSVARFGTGAYGYHASIMDGAVVLSDATIYASRNSVAKDYAEDMGINFVDSATQNGVAYAAKGVSYFADVNGDMTVSAADAQMLGFTLANDITLAAEIADVNGDGVIDAADVLALQAIID